MKKTVLATRGSALALRQAVSVKEEIEKRSRECTILKVSTKGDIFNKTSLNKIGGNGLFIREIEKKLLSNEADIAVHSAKDLPYDLESGLVIGAVMPAASPCDVLITRKGEALTKGSVIATGSARRVLQVKNLFPNCTTCDIRGNVDTRLEKLRSGSFDALVLAKAGLDRLLPDVGDFDVKTFSVDEFIPAPCQGIIAVECREGDAETLELLGTICDEETKKRFDAERYMLSLIRANCSEAIGIYAKTHGENICISAMYNGKKAVRTGCYADYRRMCEEIRSEL